MSDLTPTAIILPDVANVFIKDKALDKAAQKAFVAIFDFIASTTNLDLNDEESVKPVLVYAQSIFEARQNSGLGNEIPGSRTRLIDKAGLEGENKQVLDDLGQQFAITIPKKLPAESPEVDVCENTKTGEAQGDNSAEANAQALKLLGQCAPKLALVKNALDALNLTGLEAGETPSEEAQFILAKILQPILKEVELAQKQGQLTSQKDISDFIGRRFMRAVVSFNASNQSIKISRADINAFTDSIDTVMKTSDGTANKEEQHKMMELLLNHKGMLLGLVAMVSQPLAKIFASLPLGIGKPFNFLLAQVHSNIGPIVTAAITGSMMKGRPESRAAEAQPQSTQAA